jgi:hypothetical protein
MPLCDSSKTYARALWLWPSPADLRPGSVADVPEVSRFSCMKFLGVSGVFDYAGLDKSSRYRACSCCLPRITRASASGLAVYGAEYPPHLSSIYASLCTSRYPAQDSRPSGSLLLSREELSSSASCRFSPAHCNRLHPLHALSTPATTCSVIRHPAGLSQKNYSPLVLTALDFLTTRPQGFTFVRLSDAHLHEFSSRFSSNAHYHGS